MEVRIGVQQAPREIQLESTDTPEAVTAAVAAAVSAGGLLTLTDERGRTIVVPADKLAYVEIGSAERSRVGFGG